ncbi:MAG: PTS sugar transporter subunit IIA, partial [Planctomycetota bacterium]|nr:PTS sugar transporter subunit IIA [Planctomycetota bacterium]
MFTIGQPMDYGAPDGVPVDVFFVTVGPPADRGTHLRLLSRLAQLVLQTRFLKRVRAADTDNELMAVLLASSILHPDGKIAEA